MDIPYSRHVAPSPTRLYCIQTCRSPHPMHHIHDNITQTSVPHPKA